VLRLRFEDPGRFALRAAARTAIVVPVAFAVGMATGDSAIALFCLFGSLAVLLFVDFGGPLHARLVAYAGLAAGGAGLIALGTVCSTHIAAATVGMAVVGFAVLFAGVLNGYVATAASAALLTYILPAMVPAPAAEIPDRLAGWAIALTLSVPAALLLFPARPRDRLGRAVAGACRALAAVLREPAPAPAAAIATTRDAIGTMWRQFEATTFRPTGPTGATGALAVLVDELDRLGALVTAPVDGVIAVDCTPAERRLLDHCAATLDRAAVALEGGDVPPSDLAALEAGRADVVDDLIERLADPSLRAEDDRLWAAVAAAWEARAVSYVVHEVAERALAAGTGASRRRAAGFIRRQHVALSASGRVAAAHAGAQSVWFRNSLRAAVGLAAAVLVAQLTGVQHAFWVVFGTLSVLRSNVLGTGESILQALLGTFIGIVVGAGLLLAIGSDRVVLWCVLPVATLVAAYAPRAISFAAGQAGFTVVVFIAFDLLDPVGWSVGLVRITDVAIGCAISLAVGLLFWPRGAATVLRAAVAEALTDGGRLVTAAFARVAGQTADGAAERRAAFAADERLDAALRQRLAERSGQDLQLRPVAALVLSATRLCRTGDAMLHLAEMVGSRPRPSHAPQLARDARALGDWYAALAADLADDRAAAPPLAADPVLPAGLRADLRAALDGGHRDPVVTTLAVAWAGLHLDQLRRFGERAVQATGELAARAAVTPARPPRPAPAPPPPRRSPAA
jgi:uncharacterized membrane protein YccC